MSRLINRIGQRFGFLVVLKKMVSKDGHHTFWKCRCDCGKLRVAEIGNLKSGRTQSCGCYNRKAIIERQTTHGCAGSKQTKEYRAWLSMKARCEYQSQQNFRYYGGIGIAVCKRWRNSFIAFLTDMGYAPSVEHSLDRINPFGNYEPSNCRWATRSMQMRNTRKAFVRKAAQ